MQIELPEELEPVIEQEFATGRYASRDEVVVQALRWLQEERQRGVSGIIQGLDDVSLGALNRATDGRFKRGQFLCESGVPVAELHCAESVEVCPCIGSADFSF